MNQRKYHFKDLIRSLNNEHNQINDEYKYLGTGYPFSDILIIGKEAAITMGSIQYEEEIVKNFQQWNNLEDYNSKNIAERNSNDYSPLYPYKGQILKKDNRINYGTSVTWMNYQKLYNYIFQSTGNKNINFHKNMFLTEVNSTPSKTTINAKTESILFRKKHIFTSKFIRNFPIVIISGVGYFKINDQINEIEKIFEVKYKEKKIANPKKGSQPYWIHWNDAKTKIVINTYQLSIGIADDLLKEITEEIHNSNLLKTIP